MQWHRRPHGGITAQIVPARASWAGGALDSIPGLPGLHQHLGLQQHWGKLDFILMGACEKELMWFYVWVCFYVSPRRCKSWSNKLHFSPEATTIFLVISAGEWMVERKATWEFSQGVPAGVWCWVLFFRFLFEVQLKSRVNKMNVENLATVMGINLLKPQIEDPIAVMKGEEQTSGHLCDPEIHLNVLHSHFLYFLQRLLWSRSWWQSWSASTRPSFLLPKTCSPLPPWTRWTTRRTVHEASLAGSLQRYKELDAPSVPTCAEDDWLNVSSSSCYCSVLSCLVQVEKQLLFKEML